MRIAHVTDCYLPRSGGIEIQVHDLAARQRAAGHEVEVISCVAPTGSGRIRYHRALQQRDVVLGSDPELIHLHASNFSPLSFLTGISAGRRQLPTVFTLHSLWSYAAPVFRCSDRIAPWGDLPLVWSAVSRAAAAPLQQLLGSRATVEVLPNGVDPEFWKIDRTQRQGDGVRFVAVMRLARRKRPLALLDMFAEARSAMATDRPVSLEIIGDGPMRRAVERKIARFRLTGDVRLAGQLDRAAIRRRYERSDVFIAPATLESFGIAALEARCAGLPVIARQGTGVGEFVQHDREGLLVRDDRAMAAAMARLASDTALTERLTRHNRCVPPSVDWDKTQAACERLYRAAADRARPSARPTRAGARRPS